MGDESAIEKSGLPPRTTQTYVNRWPRWWDDIERPDVPFPKFSALRGSLPSAREILREAERIACAETDCRADQSRVDDDERE